MLMVCTGGIRSERASAYLTTNMGNQGEDVCQLAGGTERSLKEYPEGGRFWRGKNFIFNNRDAVRARNPDGDGGVLRKAPKSERENILQVLHLYFLVEELCW